MASPGTSEKPEEMREGIGEPLAGHGMTTAVTSGDAPASPPLAGPGVQLLSRLPPEVVACPDCDLLQQIPSMPLRAQAFCPRCGCVTAWQPPGPKDMALALTVTAIIVFILANTMPLMNLSVIGLTASTTIVGGALEMWNQDEELAAILIAFCVVLAPGAYLLLMMAILLGGRRAPAPHWVGELMRWASHFQVWSTLDVMMLGLLVALVKIAELATVTPGIGMYAGGTLLLLLPAIAFSFDERDLWHRIEWTPDPASERPA